jgi:hypothetical protein
MAEDTAVLDPETSTTDEAAPLEETAAELVNAEETGDENAETKGISEEEINARIEAARQEERDRHDLELNKARKNSQLASASQYLANGAEAELDRFTAWFQNELEEGRRPRVNKAVIQNLARNLASAVETTVSSTEWEAIGNHSQKWIAKNFPDYKPSQEFLRKTEKVMSLPVNDPNKADLAWSLKWEEMEAAWASRMQPEIEKRAEALAKEMLAKNKSAAQVAQTKAGDQARANAPAPTKTNGVSSPELVIANMDAADSAFNRGQLDSKQYAEYAKQFGVSLG